MTKIVFCSLVALAYLMLALLSVDAGLDLGKAGDWWSVPGALMIAYACGLMGWAHVEIALELVEKRRKA